MKLTKNVLSNLSQTGLHSFRMRHILLPRAKTLFVLFRAGQRTRNSDNPTIAHVEHRDACEGQRRRSLGFLVRLLGDPPAQLLVRDREVAAPRIAGLRGAGLGTCLARIRSEWTTRGISCWRYLRSVHESNIPLHLWNIRSNCHRIITTGRNNLLAFKQLQSEPF